MERRYSFLLFTLLLLPRSHRFAAMRDRWNNYEMKEPQLEETTAWMHVSPWDLCGTLNIAAH